MGASRGQNLSRRVKTLLTSPVLLKRTEKIRNVISNGNQPVAGDSEGGVKGNHERLTEYLSACTDKCLPGGEGDLARSEP